jgi:hypothetical protein
MGENDPANRHTRPVISALQGAGVSMEVFVMKDLGHELPEDISQRVGETLWMLLG